MINRHEPIDVLITYGWCRTSYAAARSLALRGLNVGVMDTHRVGMAQFSRYARWLGRYRDPRTDPDGFLEDVIEVARRLGPHVILTSHDETEVLAENHDCLPPGVRTALPNSSAYSRANDKAMSADLAAAQGVRIPRTYVWSDVDELRAILSANQDTVTYVIKLRKGNGSKGVYYAPSARATTDRVSSLIKDLQLPEDRFPIVQDYVSGEGWGVSCIYNDGEKFAQFTHRRLRERISTGGTSTLRTSASHPEIEDFATRLLDNLGWHGVAMVEFKVDEQGNGWFIEINPRLWGSLNLAIEAGVDFPWLLYQLAVEELNVGDRSLSQPPPNTTARWLLGDVIAALSLTGQRRFADAAECLMPSQATTLDDWTWSDPMATVGEILHYANGFIRSRSLNPIPPGSIR